MSEWKMTLSKSYLNWERRNMAMLSKRKELRYSLCQEVSSLTL